MKVIRYDNDEVGALDQDVSLSVLIAFSDQFFVIMAPVLCLPGVLLHIFWPAGRVQDSAKFYQYSRRQ